MFQNEKKERRAEDVARGERTARPAVQTAAQTSVPPCCPPGTSPGTGLSGLCGSTWDSMVMTPSLSGPQPSSLCAFTLKMYEWLGSRSSTTTEFWLGLGMVILCTSPRTHREEDVTTGTKSHSFHLNSVSNKLPAKAIQAPSPTTCIPPGTNNGQLRMSCLSKTGLGQTTAS